MKDIFLFESVVDEVLKHYSPYVFKNPKSNIPIIRKDLREKIINDIKLINKEVKVIDYFIKGSILTKQWNTNSDIDIFVRVDKAYNKESLKELLAPVLSQIDDKKFKDIPHPLQYYITNQPYNFENTEAAYDLKNNEWIKRSQSKKINVDEYLDEFNEYVQKFSDFSEELRRDVIDYEILKDLPNDYLKDIQKKVDSKLKEIENSLNDIIELYKDIKSERNDVFSTNMTPTEIKKYGIKTKLPGNVVFKMIERYHYLDLAKKIKKIIGSDKKLSQNEFEELNKYLKTRLTTEKTSFKSIFGLTKGRKDLQHKPRHRQQQDNAGMIGHGDRKSLNILPKYQRHSTDAARNITQKTKKNKNKVIRVKKGSREAKLLAQKYRIGNPTGKKVVGANKYDDGITIIFENQ